MVGQGTKLVFFVYLLVGLFGLGCIGLTRSFTLKGNPNDLPVKSFTIITELDQREEFFMQMRKFADKHALKFALVVHSPDKASFAIQIDGDGFFITAVGTTIAPREIDIGFYNAPNSSTLTPQETVDALMDDLKRFINEIPNVRIRERQQRLIITNNKSQREELFAQMKALAEKHSLEYELFFYEPDRDPDRTCFLVEVRGEDFHLTSDCYLNTLDKINIDFYLDYYKNPTATSQETLDELLEELKSLLGEFPNVIITEEK